MVTLVAVAVVELAGGRLERCRPVNIWSWKHVLAMRSRLCAFSQGLSKTGFVGTASRTVVKSSDLLGYVERELGEFVAQEGLELC